MNKDLTRSNPSLVYNEKWQQFKCSTGVSCCVCLGVSNNILFKKKQRQF